MKRHTNSWLALNALIAMLVVDVVLVLLGVGPVTTGIAGLFIGAGWPFALDWLLDWPSERRARNERIAAERAERERWSS